MHRCPSCHKKTISIFECLFYYSKLPAKCSNCGASVRRKIRLSDYLVAIYLLSILAARRFLHVDTNNNLGIFFGIAIALFALQLKLVKYEVE